MLQNAASDLGLHCLPMPLLWNASLKALICTFLEADDLRFSFDAEVLCFCDEAFSLF